jgi:hypothetical protein
LSRKKFLFFILFFHYFFCSLLRSSHQLHRLRRRSDASASFGLRLGRFFGLRIGYIASGEEAKGGDAQSAKPKRPTARTKALARVSRQS